MKMIRVLEQKFHKKRLKDCMIIYKRDECKESWWKYIKFWEVKRRALFLFFILPCPKAGREISIKFSRWQMSLREMVLLEISKPVMELSTKVRISEKKYSICARYTNDITVIVALVYIWKGLCSQRDKPHFAALSKNAWNAAQLRRISQESSHTNQDGYPRAAE